MTRTDAWAQCTHCCNPYIRGSIACTRCGTAPEATELTPEADTMSNDDNDDNDDSLNTAEALDHFIMWLPEYIAVVHGPLLQVDEEDDIRTWVADIEDIEFGETGVAVFNEHCGEIGITWN